MLTWIGLGLIGLLVVAGIWLADGHAPPPVVAAKVRIPRVFGRWLPLMLAAASFAIMTYVVTH